MHSTRLGEARYLFMDDSIIASQHNLFRRVNRPILAGPALSPGAAGAWDDGYLGAYGQVMEVDGTYRMYIMGRSAKMLAGKFDAGGRCFFPLGVATSADGIHWTKPNLQIMAWEGSKDNNITCPDWGFVFEDPLAPSEQRFKLLCTGYYQLGAHSVFDALSPEVAGLYIYTSPDGLHWSWHPKRLLALHPDTHNMLYYDASRGRYTGYLRSWPHGFMRGKTIGRAVARIELTDPMSPWPVQPSPAPLKCWGKQYIANLREELPTVLAYPEFAQEDHWTDIYTPSVLKYPWADNVYLAFPELNHYLPDSEIPNHSRLEIGMATSRDGIQWHWPNTEPYIPLDMPGRGRGGMLYSLVGMLRVGDQIFEYHAGTDLEHHGKLGEVYGLEGLCNSGSIYRTVQRLDGFVSLDADRDGGELTTLPLTMAAPCIRINADASRGVLRYALYDSQERPIPGLGFGECDPLLSDGIAQDLSWQGETCLHRLVGQRIRLHIQLTDAKLYAIEFSQQPSDANIT